MQSEKKFLINTKTGKQLDSVNKIISGFDFSDRCIVLSNGKNDEYILIKTLDELQSSDNRQRIIDNTLPIWNTASISAIEELAQDKVSWVASYELMFQEICDISSSCFIPAYGYIPVMKTKNCIRLTNDDCRKQSGFEEICDRKNIAFPVECDCSSCINIIYNSVPLSIHNIINKRALYNMNYYFNFTVETGETTEAIINYYFSLFSGEDKGVFPVQNYTTGHFQKAVL